MLHRTDLVSTSRMSAFRASVGAVSSRFGLPCSCCSCLMVLTIGWVCFTPSLTHFWKSACDKSSADASSITAASTTTQLWASVQLADITGWRQFMPQNLKQTLKDRRTVEVGFVCSPWALAVATISVWTLKGLKLEVTITARIVETFIWGRLPPAGTKNVSLGVWRTEGWINFAQTSIVPMSRKADVRMIVTQIFTLTGIFFASYTTDNKTLHYIRKLFIVA